MRTFRSASRMAVGASLPGRLGTLAIPAFVALGMMGCARPWGTRAAQPDTPLLVLDLRPDKEVYQPGEAVVCSLVLTNAAKKAITTSPLCADTVEFWYGPAGTDLRFRRAPVRSAREKACESVKLGPGEKVRREFLLADVTEEEGVGAIHAFYRPTAEKRPDSPYYIAPAALFKVDGPVLFRRGRNGLLLKDQAIAVAKEWAERPQAKADAVLVRNEAGFLDWWVTLERDEKADPKAEPGPRAALISAHTGAVRAAARPRPKSIPAGAPQARKGGSTD